MAYNQSDQYFEPSTDTDANFANSVSTQANSFFLPAVYSKKVLNFFRKASVIEAITNTDYAGEIANFGDSVKIIKEPSITVYQYERGADVTQTKLTDAEITLVVDTANAFKFKVDDIESNMSHVNWRETASSAAAYALRDAFDEEHDPIDILGHMARLLDDQNIPEEGRWFVAPPQFYEVLTGTASKLLSVDYNAGQGSIRNGLVTSGKLRGFNMYKSNNIASTTNAAGKCIAGHISSTATAQTITSSEVLRDPDSFGDIVRGLHVYGAKVLRSEALVSAFYGVD